MICHYCAHNFNRRNETAIMCDTCYSRIFKKKLNYLGRKDGKTTKKVV